MFNHWQNSSIAPDAFLLLAPTSGMLLPGMTILGVIAAGVVLAIFFRRHERKLQALSAQIAGDLEEARTLRQQMTDARTQAAHTVAEARRIAERLDARFASLDGLSSRMHQARAAIAHAKNDFTRNEQTIALPVKLNRAPLSQPNRVDQRAAKDAPDASARPAAPLVQRVYALADAGRAPLSIARDLDEQVGAVELVLALRARSPAASKAPSMP